ncbi:MAG: 4-hydroxy-tetrahydrodipicolinate reductase [Candidatus Firestonebacteria bacterium RIFOXYC2_FULL_39_67]|nr:MAG: 4-hydroxy-tetrahydrodipicolinate reductase [Candidatus Firestonebacteria bacterium RIFOXYD2_FULL_39_29]OGF53958.1 MAG: 4-hydroxy-tetrahydrodipicolinate reductase [Candidatus Firestonebacteria bacterium RIFOXYC2_FULL_39_67]
MIKVIIIGAAGRMGSVITKNIAAEKGVTIAGVIESAKFPGIGKDIGYVTGNGKIGVNLSSNLSEIAAKCDVIIDFTLPASSLKNLEIAVKFKKAVIIGTTGFNDAEKKLIAAAGKAIPVVFAPSMSIGVNLLFKLVKEAAEVLKGYDAEIIETHHRFKKDAPSGTALRLGESIASGKGVDFKKNTIFGREGIVGERKPGEIAIHAVRSGDVAGEHVVSFGTIGERIELVHKASSREAYASGTILAVRYIYKAKAGLYDMQDVLGLK